MTINRFSSMRNPVKLTAMLFVVAAVAALSSESVRGAMLDVGSIKWAPNFAKLTQIPGLTQSLGAIAGQGDQRVVPGAQAKPGAPEQPAAGDATVSLLVKTVPGLADSEVDALMTRAGAKRGRGIGALRLQVVRVPQAAVDGVMHRFRADSSVERVEVDQRRQIARQVLAPSDPGHAAQWGLETVRWNASWQLVNPIGSARIAVLDTGVSPAVGEIALADGWSAFGTDPKSDPNGHGTWVASIAAAVGDNSQGVAGVSFAKTAVLPVQVLDANGMGQDSDIINGVLWAVENKADVILMAFSNPGYSQSLQDAIDLAWSNGIVIVAATGNEASSTPTFPAGDAKVVGVAATDQADALWLQSNSGKAAFLAAPGVDISGLRPDGSILSTSGTSASAAMVAGAAALLKIADPLATNGVIVGRLARNADVAGTQEQTGNGRLNIERALADVSLEEVVPVGAPPEGDGGPFVGPYSAAVFTNLTIGPQSPNPVVAGNSATYSISIARNNNGGDTATFTVSGLPSGATGSFIPASVSWSGSDRNARTSTLTVQTLASTPGGSPTITVSTNEQTGVTASRALVVTAACTAPSVGAISGAGAKTVGDPLSLSVTATGSAPLAYQWKRGTTNVGSNSASYGVASVTSADAGNYTVVVSNSCASATSDAAAVSVAKATPTITWNNPADISYGTALGATQLNPTASVPGTFVYTPAAGTVLNAGNAQNLSAEFTPTDTANHSTVSKTVQINVLKADQTITFDALPNKTYGDPSFALTATGGASGNPVTFALGAGSAGCSLSGNMVSLTAATAAGQSCIIIASQAGIGNYNAAVDVSRSFTIAKATPVVSATGGSFSYTGSQHAGSGTAVGVDDVQLPVTLSYSGTGMTTYAPTATAPTNVGTYTVTASFAGNSNHESATSAAVALTIGKAASTVTVTCAPDPQTYTGAAIAACAATVTGAGGLNQELTVDYTNNVNVGTATANASWAGDDNHTGNSGSATFAIGKATSTVTVSCPTDPQTYTGSPITACSAKATGAGGLDQTLTVSYTDNMHVGTAHASASFAGGDNHSGSNGAGTFAIGKASSTTVVTVSDATFDGNAHGGTAQVTGAGGLNESVVVSYSGRNGTTYAASAAAPTAAGDYTASATFVGDANHTGSSDSKDFTIGKASSTTVVTVANATYDGNPHGGTAQVTGAGGLNESVAVSYSGRNGTTYGPSATAPTAAGDYTASASYSASANHQGSNDSKTFEIGKKAVTGSFTADSKVYDGNPSATVLTRSISGAVEGDSVTLSGGTATFDNKNVGSGKAVTLAGANLSGTAASNYALTSVETASADITRLDLTVAATAQNKAYDGNTTATVSTLSTTKLAADTVTAGYTNAAFDTKNVGINKTVTVTGLSISGVDAGNYNLTNTTTTATASILPKGLAGKFTAANKSYDGNDSATVSTRSLEGIVAGDVVSHSGGTARFNNAAVGNNKPVTLTGASLTGTDAANYALASMEVAAANITAWDANGRGFYQPVGVGNSVFVASGSGALPLPGSTTVWNAAKGGSTIPLKFNIFAGTTELTDISTITGFSVVGFACTTNEALVDVVDFVTTGHTSLRYDTTEKHFIQNWKTPSVSKDSCYRATATLADGSTLSAFFRLKK